MLKRIYGLKNEIQIFLNLKNYVFPHFCKIKLISNFGFLIDITQHFNDLNFKLQEKHKLFIISMKKFKLFEQKLYLWK